MTIAESSGASRSTINQQLRYAGRLSVDPINTLAQGEAHLLTARAVRLVRETGGAITVT